MKLPPMNTNFDAIAEYLTSEGSKSKYTSKSDKGNRIAMFSKFAQFRAMVDGTGPVLDHLITEETDLLYHIGRVAKNLQAMSFFPEREDLYSNWYRDRMECASHILANIGAGTEIQEGFRCKWGCNIVMGKNVEICSGVKMLDYNLIAVADQVKIREDVILVTSSMTEEYECFTAPIIIEKNVKIDPRAIILPGVHIKEGARILAGIKVGAGNVVKAGATVDKDLVEKTEEVKKIKEHGGSFGSV